MRIFLSAGEASGDAYAARLAQGLQDLGTIEGVGGKRLTAWGNHKVIIDSSQWGAVGILESLRVVPRILQDYYRAKKQLLTGEPGLLIPIDYGYMNVRLARHGKRKGWKVVYFVPPGSWRKNKQGSDLPHVTDAIVTPFSWSAEILNQMGANAVFFGHPLKQMVREAKLDDSGQREGIALLPGSRQQEIEANLAVIASATQGIDGTLRFGVASTQNASALQRMWQEVGGREAEYYTSSYAALMRSRAAIVCSGTATLESALCGCPTLVMYRGSKAMEWEYRIRRPKFDYISLPNILLDRPALPELIQWDATPDSVRSILEDLLEDSPARAAQLSAFAELDGLLGASDALDQSIAYLRNWAR
ncbi:MAG: hypothetical protein MUC92_05685 [Fimbriimonadaceae bacterium]|jgi:lipid-A-disaccharide synthase|nr:hypothetical protein [Fimbriimonadaceae bacterium]